MQRQELGASGSGLASSKSACIWPVVDMHLSESGLPNRRMPAFWTPAVAILAIV